METAKRCNMLMVLVVLALSTLPHARAEGEQGIGEAIVEERNDQAGGRKLLTPGASFSHEPKSAGLFTTQDPSPEDLQRRKLLLGGCSDSDGSVEAVFHCTNAVRVNPGGFAPHYPCDSSRWLPDLLTTRRPPLSRNYVLERMAMLHSDDMARMSRMSHVGSDGSRLGTRASRVQYNYRIIGENVAYGFRSAKDVVMAWMCSEGHRENMMNCAFGEIGLGVDKNTKGTLYHTQNFGCSMGGQCGCNGGRSAPPPPPVFVPQPAPPSLPPRVFFPPRQAPPQLPPKPIVPVSPTPFVPTNPTPFVPTSPLPIVPTNLLPIVPTSPLPTSPLPASPLPIVPTTPLPIAPTSPTPETPPTSALPSNVPPRPFKHFFPGRGTPISGGNGFKKGDSNGFPFLFRFQGGKPGTSGSGFRGLQPKNGFFPKPGIPGNTFGRNLPGGQRSTRFLHPWFFRG